MTNRKPRKRPAERRPSYKGPMKGNLHAAGMQRKMDRITRGWFRKRGGR